MASFVILIFIEFAVLRRVTYAAYTQRFVCLYVFSYPSRVPFRQKGCSYLNANVVKVLEDAREL